MQAWVAELEPRAGATAGPGSPVTLIPSPCVSHVWCLGKHQTSDAL